MKMFAAGAAVLLAATIATPFSAAWSDDAPMGVDAIAKRQELMKSVGRATKAAGDMVKGEKPWDQAVAEDAMDTLIEVGTTFPSLFPDDSKTGHDTEAAPAIWEQTAEFDAKAAALAEDAEAAKMAAANGLDAFKPAFGKTARNCRDCHEQFRVK
ncbi:cytochrome c [Amorphus sp. 3PC139-8]|uniref:c-type cytochrome n=1 Tax=Amorphus sp. 3PC139-8 TaxID=2735676 RepID=UPI00345CAB63